MSEANPEFPLLIFGRPGPADRNTLPPANPPRARPKTGSQQNQRLSSGWQHIENLMQDKQVSLQRDMVGTDPELVLVFEVAGTIADFHRAASRIGGLNFLADLESDTIDKQDFVEDGEEERLGGSVYLTGANQSALRQILGLWQRFSEDEKNKFPRGFAPWRQLFRLVAVRPWSASDRVNGTGILELVALARESGVETLQFETEVWFKGNTTQRRRAGEQARAAVEVSGGSVVAQSVITEIRYHALLVEMPVQALLPVIDGEPARLPLAVAQSVAFLRPEAHASVLLGADDEHENNSDYESGGDVTGSPLVALLDGLPFSEHHRLGDRIEVDDPEAWGPLIPTASRRHGTAMASIIAHGDLSGAESTSLRRPIHVRPVLRPNADGSEATPVNELAIDLIHRAVLRIFGPDGDGSAPDTKIINLSVGDPQVQLATTLSPWSRLIDHLSHKFSVLFIISAGNHLDDIVLPVSPGVAKTLSGAELRALTLKSISDTAHERRLLSPGEAVNALSVGAAHNDETKNWVQDSRIDLLPSLGSASFPSPVSARGLGFRRSIKPDLIVPGGRALYKELPAPAGSTSAVFRPSITGLAPGVLAASPGGASGSTNALRHFIGTSVSAAALSHHGGLILESLISRAAAGGREVDPNYLSIITKALLLHATRIPPAADEMRSVLGDMSPQGIRDSVCRFYGYGVFNPDLLQNSAARATAIAWGSLRDGRAHVYTFPLPPSFSGHTAIRRLKITLAYFAPTASTSRHHREVELWFKPDEQKLAVKRKDAWHSTVRKGTVQHEVLEGDRAVAIVDGDELLVQVNCRRLGAGSPDATKYGLVVTFETDAAIPIYSEISTRLRSRIQSQAPRARAAR